ncbi:MAG: family 20 glycosylhydrolase [Firmicutes bacterium]|nr:family 20 glycosylhydrolase [Bacillota bacterium]
MMKKSVLTMLCILMSMTILLPTSPVFADAGADSNADSDAKNTDTFSISETSRFYIVTEEEPAEEILETVQLSDGKFAASQMPSGESLGIVCGSAKHIKAGDIVIRMDSLAVDSAQTAAGIQGANAEEPQADDETEAGTNIQGANAEEPQADDETEAGTNIQGAKSADVEAAKASQGYEIVTSTDGTVWVTAKSSRGLMYGLDELLRLMLLSGGSISCNISEVPASAERTLLLDCGRKYYSPEWIENLIKRMSWQRYTALQLHFSDSEGFRLESEQYPWLTEGEECLTISDLEEICQVANAYHIEIIPELDTPGHMEYIIRKYREHVQADPDFSFTYNGKNYSRDDEGFADISNYSVYRGARSLPSNAGIDLSNEVARAFTASLIDEYADFFAEHGSSTFCIGGDEIFGWNGAKVGGRSFDHNSLWYALEHWVAYAETGADTAVQGETEQKISGADVFIEYLNETAERLAGKGFACRVWNDEMHRMEEQRTELSPEIDIIYWSNDYYPAEDLAKNGNLIHNSDTDWCYYVVRPDKHGGDIMDRTRKYCNAKNIYENWNPRNCARSAGEPSLIPEESCAGGYFAIWSDSPDYKDEKTVWEDTNMRTWANSVRLWNGGDEEKTGYSKFMKYTEIVGTFPGYGGDPSAKTLLPEAAAPEIMKLSMSERISAWFGRLF